MPLDPTQLARFSQLALRAQGLVEGLVGGMHKSPFKGMSVEFAEHRQYYPGDDIRHIDWRVFGKTDRHFIKEFEEETNLPAWLAVDASGSMAYAGRGPTKYRHAAEAAVVLAYLLLQQRDAVGLFVHDDRPRDLLPPSSQSAHWVRIAQTLEKLNPAGEGSLGPAWLALADRMKRRGLVLLFTDAFSPIADLTLALRRLRHDGHDVVLFQILAPEEIDFPFRSAMEFRSLEGGSRQRVDPVRVRQNYRDAFDRHNAALAERAAEMGVEHAILRTDRPLDQSLGEFLARRGARLG